MVLTDKCRRCGVDIEVEVEDVDDTLYQECFCSECKRWLKTMGGKNAL